MDDDQFRQLLNFFNMSWKGYRKVRKGVKKRVAGHMQDLACRNLQAYLERLRKEPAALRECERRMTVPISRFFRDRALWDHLESDALPRLVTAFPGRVRAWSAGCSGGEEAYSLKILWKRLQTSRRGWPPLSIVGSDLIPEHLGRARKARYPKSSLKRAAEHHLDLWPGKDQKESIRVPDTLRGGMDWIAHHLLSPPFRIRFHMILLRNSLLTYYEDPTRALGLTAVIDHLHPGGLLIIGARERIPAGLLPALRETDQPMVYIRTPSPRSGGAVGISTPEKDL